MTVLLKTVWDFPEELRPGGEPGSVRLLAEFPRNQQATTLIAVRVARSPWFIIIWEKLTDSVPGPDETKIWCCYVRTVIFYKKPWQTTENGFDYQRWAEIDSTLRCDDVVEFEQERFEVGTGMVVWYEGAWWCRSWARR